MQKDEFWTFGKVDGSPHCGSENARVLVLGINVFVSRRPMHWVDWGWLWLSIVAPWGCEEKREYERESGFHTYIRDQHTLSVMRGDMMVLRRSAGLMLYFASARMDVA
jgi:hypothetical protein